MLLLLALLPYMIYDCVCLLCFFVCCCLFDFPFVCLVCSLLLFVRLLCLFVVCLIACCVFCFVVVIVRVRDAFFVCYSTITSGACV